MEKKTCSNECHIIDTHRKKLSLSCGSIAPKIYISAT